MSVPTLDRPAAGNATDTPAPSRAEPAGRTRPHGHRVLGAALLASLLVHGAAFLLVRFQFQFRLTPGARVESAPTDNVMRAVQLVEVADAAEAEVQPELDRESEPPIVSPAAPPTTIAPATPVAPPVVTEPPPIRAGTPPATARRSIADRLGPRMGDPSLWAGPSRATAPPSRLDVARAELGSRIAAYNDSLRAAEDAAARRLDWTAEDANGGKWGVSPGKLHLGSITLPLPIQFSMPADRRDEFNRRLADWSAIQLQRARADAQETIKQRAKEIRERKAAADTSRAGGG